MKIAVLGTGYVGLVTGTCLSSQRNQVTCIDIDPNKVAQLQKGQIPIYEPGLKDLVLTFAQRGDLQFTTDPLKPCREADLIFLAVGTPEGADGKANLNYLWQAAQTIAPVLSPKTVIVIKSTVPVGTNRRLQEKLKSWTGRTCEVASNPEFLREGSAVQDFLSPDRVVIGVRSDFATEQLRRLYRPFLPTPEAFVTMSPESAETTKYVANAFLATKISFINEMSQFCDSVEADIDDVRHGISFDPRIGSKFLNPGVGYGGSCFPKDVKALRAAASQLGLAMPIMNAVDTVNARQKQIFPRKILTYLAHEAKKNPVQYASPTVAIWGLAFKPGTDDIREAPALVLADQLLAHGVKVRVFDPQAMANVREIYGDRLQYCKNPLATAEGANALAVMTEWKEFRHPDWIQLKQAMRTPAIFDGRNLYARELLQELGFMHVSIGRPEVHPQDPLEHRAAS
ncbi:UDP-glucose 6-dehydrogenase [Planctomycetales bacterium 10988]|nr:UDP-glucose 6-dehydrogenase [Planctomycetales bacterium 10988]